MSADTIFCLSALDNHPYSYDPGNLCLTEFAGSVRNLVLYYGDSYCLVGMNLGLCFV